MITKAMSLSARYFLKSAPENTTAENETVQGRLTRDTIVVVHEVSDKEKKAELYYRVLGIYEKYCNKLFLQLPTAKPHQWLPGKAPNVRLSLKLMKRKKIGSSTNLVFESVKGYSEHNAKEVHRSIHAKDIVRVEGILEKK